MSSLVDGLTDAQNELFNWIKKYMKEFQHSPSIRQMMQAMGLKSPAPIQSRLKHLQEKGYISWQEGKARTLQIIDEMIDEFEKDITRIQLSSKKRRDNMTPQKFYKDVVKGDSIIRKAYRSYKLEKMTSLKAADIRENLLG